MRGGRRTKVDDDDCTEVGFYVQCRSFLNSCTLQLWYENKEEKMMVMVRYG